MKSGKVRQSNIAAMQLASFHFPLYRRAVSIDRSVRSTTPPFQKTEFLELPKKSEHLYVFIQRSFLFNYGIFFHV